ncbi:hypothetical protein J6590_038456 [Homalodisca vitripennis]|nr:hypothetical protein J6590_038456 [Homalodisca vitripennis]
MGNKEILTVVSHYILAVISSACKNGLQRLAAIHQHNTRFANNWNLPFHCTALYTKKPAYAQFYNLLPDELKCRNNHKLRVYFKKWLAQQSFYTVDEFLSWRNFDRYI